MNVNNINRMVNVTTASAATHGVSAAKRLTKEATLWETPKGTDLLSKTPSVWVATAGGADPTGGLWAVMMDYQKLANREHRADRQLVRQDARVELKLKEAKFEREKEEIAAMKDEAGERFDRAMEAATTEMIMGFASDSAAAASAATSSGASLRAVERRSGSRTLRDPD